MNNKKVNNNEYISKSTTLNNKTDIYRNTTTNNFETNTLKDSYNIINNNINDSIIQTIKYYKLENKQKIIGELNASRYKQLEINNNINKNNNNIKNKNYNSGHRQRVINKLKENGYEQLEDYEIVELMLFLVFKRKDTKLMAKMLLEKFKNLDNILNAQEEDLMKIDGIGKSTCNAFKIINNIIKFSLKSKIINRNIIVCFNDVINYIKLNMRNLNIEEVRLIILNSKNAIIDDIVMQKGSIDSVEIYPQEILKHCINKGAKSIILIHNHPSGDPTPSTQDIYMTNKIQEATNIFNITLFDHIIIGGDNYTSFRSLKLLKD